MTATAQRSGSQLRIAAAIGGWVGLAVGLHALGRGALAFPGWQADAWTDRLDVDGPATVAVAVVRAVAEGLAWYVVAVALLSALSTRGPHRLQLAITTPAVRRLVAASLGLAALTTAHPRPPSARAGEDPTTVVAGIDGPTAAAQPLEPPTATARPADLATATARPLADAAATARLLDAPTATLRPHGAATATARPIDTASEVTTSHVATPTAAPDVALVPTTWTVAPGESLWSIAEDVAAAVPVVDTASYWARLVEANRHRLADPDLIFPGQVLELPDVAVTAEARSARPSASTP